MPPVAVHVVHICVIRLVCLFHQCTHRCGQVAARMSENEEISLESREEEKSSTDKPEEPAVASTELADSTKGKGDEDANEGTSQPDTKEEDEPTPKATAKQPRKLRCHDPTDTVDLAIGESGITTKKPVTISEFFKKTFDEMPDVKALCWKDNKDDPWQSITYADYKKLIYSVAKSFLKVLYH